MLSFTRNLVFSLVVGLFLATAGAFAAEDGQPVPGADELAQDAALVEAVAEVEPAVCEVAVLPEIVPDVRPGLCPDNQCTGPGDGCYSVCPYGGTCVQHAECPSPVCHCHSY